MWNAEFNLYLYSESPCAPRDCQSLHNTLLKCKFIGGKIGRTENATRYQTGDKFLSLLSFMGCSPNIEIVPQENKPYCYIEIENTPTKTAFISGKNLRKYTCPECKQRINAIGELINTALHNNTPLIHCTHCHHPIHYNNINWRKTGFVAKHWVVVGNIYESEAVPNDNLLSYLKKVTRTSWRFAYIRSPDVSETSREAINPVIDPG